jgi:hypothetical protein
MLFISLCCGMIPFAGGMILLMKNTKNGNPFVENSMALPLAFGAAFIPPALIFILAWYSLMTNYNGLCIGPPDYTAPCSYSEYLYYHLFQSIDSFGYMLLCFLSMGWGSMAFGLTALYFRNNKKT